MPRAAQIEVLRRAIVAAPAQLRIRIVEELVPVLALNDIDLEAWRPVLGTFANDPEPMVRAKLAAGCRFEGEALLPDHDEIAQHLERDRDPHVLAAFSLHPFTLRMLAWHPLWGVRWFVANNPNAGAAAALAEQSPTLRRIIAFTSTLPLAVGVQLSNDPDPQVRRFLASRSQWSDLVPVLETLARDPDVEVRRRLAENKHVPVETIEQLVTDPEVGFQAHVTLAERRGQPRPNLREWLSRK